VSLGQLCLQYTRGALTRIRAQVASMKETQTSLLPKLVERTEAFSFFLEGISTLFAALSLSLPLSRLSRFLL
jgi:hypothetical protein